MADYDLEAKITADASGYEAGVKKAEKASKKLSTSVSKVIQGLGKNGLVGALGAVGLASQGLTSTLGAVVKIARKVSETMNECTNAYKNQLIAERALDTAIQNNPFVTGASADALKQFASEMQKVSNYGDEELIPMMSNLISLGRTEAETMQIMSVAMDMSAGMGISLDTAINQLNATLNGNIGRLGQQNAELKDLTEEELKQGKAIEILGEKFKGLSSATVDTSKQLQNIKGDFKEALGQFTLPSSDMWNKFWTGFYEKGINVIKQLNEFLDVNIIGKNMLSNFETYAKGLSSEKDKGENIQSYLWTISDDELNAMNKYLEKQNKLNEIQKLIYERTQKEVERRKYLAELVAEENALEAENARKKAEQENEEKEIVKLKETHLQKIAEQEAKWENIKKVTGEEVALQEKLKFYQDDLVAIMTEAGGKISTNNQYYKDQKKIIDDIIKLIEEEGGSLEDLGNIAIDTRSKFQIFFEELAEELKASQKSLKDYVKIASSALGKMFEKLGKELVEGSVSWKSYAKIAVEAIAEVLKSLSAQLSAMAVARIANYDYATAAVAAAGATSAMIASGALTQVASKMDAIKESTDSAGKSIEQFKESLQNIDTSFTRSSSDVLQTIRKYNIEYQELKANADSAYEAYRKASNEAGEAWRRLYEKFPNGWVEINGRKNPLEEEAEALSARADALYNQYEQLNNIALQAKTAMKNAGKEVIENYKKQADAVSETVSAYKELYSSAKNYKSLLETWNLYSSREQSQLIVKSLFGQNNIYKQLQEARTYYEILFEEQRSNVSKIVSNLYSEITQTGKKIGETLVSSIVNGASKADFMGQMKDYIKQSLIQLTVYTESFQEQLAEIGNSLSSALIVGNRVNLRNVKKQIESLYDNAVKKAKEAEDIISYVFRDLGESIQDSISDFGENIANTLVDSLSNGLDQSNFLDSIKKWIRKMLIQTVVYTKAMKSEIESIGTAISKGLSEGFTDTTLHEIRRDLSWVFEQANKTIANIDDVLNSVFSGYATGTNNASSGLHLVGEAGPELVKFRGGEQVLNNHNTNKALAEAGGKTNNFNVTFNNLQDTSAFAMINQLKQYNRQMAINGII